MGDEGYERLEIYKRAHALAVETHKMTLNLPKFELYEEASQIRRSSKSISSQIVEGYCLRNYKQEYLHYLYRAHASCRETSEHLKYLFDTESLKDKKLYDVLEQRYKELSKMIYQFIKSVEKGHLSEK